MKNSNGDYSNKRIINILLSFFSYLTTLGLFYFMIMELYYKSELKRGFTGLERILIEANSSWIDPIQMWFGDLLQEEGALGLIWLIISLIIVSELIKLSLNTYLFKYRIEKFIDEAVIESTGIDDPHAELKKIMQNPGMSIWGNYLLKPSDPGYSEETQEKAKNLSRGRKLHFGLSTGLYLGLSILSMFALFGILSSIYPGLWN